MSKPLILDIPYPSVDILTEDLQSAAIISPAYAASHSEMTALSQYIYHHFNFYKLGLESYADILENIGIAEMVHFDLLGKALWNLGVNPVMSARPPIMNNYFNTSYVSYSVTPQKMIMDDLEGELKAIEDYKAMLTKLDNEQVAALIKRIILDEENHVQVLTQVLHKLTRE